MSALIMQLKCRLAYRHPFDLKWGKRDMYVDLGAEKLIAAEKEGQQISRWAWKKQYM